MPEPTSTTRAMSAPPTTGAMLGRTATTLTQLTAKSVHQLATQRHADDATAMEKGLASAVQLSNVAKAISTGIFGSSAGEAASTIVTAVSTAYASWKAANERLNGVERPNRLWHDIAHGVTLAGALVEGAGTAADNNYVKAAGTVFQIAGGAVVAVALPKHPGDQEEHHRDGDLESGLFHGASASTAGSIPDPAGSSAVARQANDRELSPLVSADAQQFMHGPGPANPQGMRRAVTFAPDVSATEPSGPNQGDKPAIRRTGTDLGGQPHRRR